MKFRSALVIVVSIGILLFAGCGGGETTADESKDDGIGTWSITIDIAGEDPVQFTNEDAAEIGPREIIAAVKDKDISEPEHTYTGILLDDILKHVNVDSYTVISIVSKSGVSVELDPSRIDPQGTGIAWAVDGKKLNAEDGPVQLVNNGRGPKWWITQVSSIAIVR